MSILPLERVADFQAALLPAVKLNLPNPLIHLNIADNTDMPFRHQVLTANAARHFEQPALSLYRYPAGTLVDGDAFEPYATLSEGTLIRQQLPDWVANPDRLAIELAARGENAPRVQQPCLLAARYGDVTWGHWFCEMLTKIVLAEQAEPKRFTFVVPTRTTRAGGPISDAYVTAVMQSLLAYGIESHRLLRIPPRQPVRFDALFDIAGIFPLAGQEHFGMHPGLIEAMQDELKLVSTDKLPRKPYIVRSANDYRQITNGGDLLEVVRKHDYTPLDMAGVAFEQQVKLFREATSVAGALGSGLAGAIYAQPGLKLLTVAPIDWPDNYFVNIFQKKDFRHADIRGQSTRSINNSVALSPFQMPVADVEDGLGQLSACTTLNRTAGTVRLGTSLLPRRLGDEIFAITFGASGTAGRYQARGWSDAEAEHTWSMGAACELRLPLADLPAQDVWLEAVGFSFSPAASALKPLSVSINGELLGEHWLTGDSRPIWFVAQAALARQNPVIIRFSHPNSASPNSLGISPDERPLGFGFVRIAFLRTRPL